jgi:hypothetical protein
MIRQFNDLCDNFTLSEGTVSVEVNKVWQDEINLKSKNLSMSILEKNLS